MEGRRGQARQLGRKRVYVVSGEFVKLEDEWNLQRRSRGSTVSARRYRSRWRTLECVGEARRPPDWIFTHEM